MMRLKRKETSESQVVRCWHKEIRCLPRNDEHSEKISKWESDIIPFAFLMVYSANMMEDGFAKGETLGARRLIRKLL